MGRNDIARGLLIAALAFVFGAFGIWKFASPILWIGWIPLWMEGLLGLTRDTWLQVIGAIEIILAVLLLIPHRRLRQIAAILMALHLVAVLTQTGWNDITVRDTALLLSTFALLLLL